MNQKIILEIEKGVYCYNLPQKAKNKIEKNLTFKNPPYESAIKAGRYVPINMPTHLRYFQISDDKKTYWFPRGYLYFFKKWLEDKYGEKQTTIKDKTLLLPKININFKGKLREYQEKAVNDIIKKYPQGILNSGVGSGKTVMACGVITARKQPTLVVVHSKELLYQWQEAIKKFIDYDCGLIGDGKNMVKPITVGIINSVKKKIKELSPKFGQIILDECLVAGTLIDDIPIENIKVGDYVNSFNHKSNKIEKKKVLHCFKKEPKTLCTIKLQNGKKITCTENHPFFTDKGYVPASELNNKIFVVGIKAYQIGEPKFTFTIEKVERVTRHTQRSKSTFGIVCKDGYVYNLEVEDNHNYFAGGILVHNCHRAAASTWSETLVEFPAKHHLGLSATIYRRDELTKGIIACIGPKLHVVNKEMLHDIGAVLKPKIAIVHTNFKYFYSDDYSAMISSLCENEERNKLIAHLVHSDFKRFKENVLIVSDRKNHCTELQNRLLSMQLKSHVLTGATPAKKRIKIVEDVKSNKCNILISTTQLIGEGFDCPNLSALFLTTPIKFSGRIIQCSGRILRPAKNKVPRIYDFRDINVGLLRNQGLSRDKVYNKQWG